MDTKIVNNFNIEFSMGAVRRPGTHPQLAEKGHQAGF
jgi:hypothetical protein